MKFGAEFVDLEAVNFTPELLRCVPAEIARKHRILPVFDRPGCLAIVLADPSDLHTVDILHHILQKPELEIRVAEGQQLDRFIHRLYGD